MLIMGKIWFDYLKVGNDWNGLILSDHSCFGYIRNLGDFSSQSCIFVRRDYCGASKRSNSWAQLIFAKHEKHDNFQTHGLKLDSMCNPELRIHLG